MPTLLTHTQTENLSCGASSSAVAQYELGNLLPFPVDVTHREDQIYQIISRDYAAGEVSAPARIVRYFKDLDGFRASLVESPTRSALVLATQFNAMAPEWWTYSRELWQWRNWSWRWARGLRARDFGDHARVLMICAVPGGLHYILARRVAGVYQVMDPAFGTNTVVANNTFNRFAGFNWFDKKSWAPVEPLYTGRDNYYLGIAIWINTADAPWVLY